MFDTNDWAGTTWEGNRQRQHERFRALSFGEKVRVVEQMSEVAALLRAKWHARNYPVPRSDATALVSLPGRADLDASSGGPDALAPDVVESMPGGDVVLKGCHDLGRGVESVESLLVSIGAPRLRALGLRIASVHLDPELKLYARLSAVHGNGAHSRYNALLRRLVSFQHALACVR